jgi:hypothetical protein
MLPRLAPGRDRACRHDGSLRNAKGDRDVEQSSGLISFIKADLPAMILDNLLRNSEAQSAASILPEHDWQSGCRVGGEILVKFSDDRQPLRPA